MNLATSDLSDIEHMAHQTTTKRKFASFSLRPLGKRRFPTRSTAIAITVALALSSTHAATGQMDRLPELGDYSASVLSTLEEEKLGREFIRDARRTLTFVDDPELHGYLNELGQRLADSSDTPGRRYSFYLVKDPALNAFAVPGGHIALHTGLILATQHESELASVLAHEIAHITQRHLPRMLAALKNQSIPATAAIIAAILLGGQAGQAALAATNASLIDRQLKYSREFEQEADAIGISTLARSGLDPRSMPVFFERLQQWARIQESDAPEFLRTHPLTTNRIAESMARAERYPRPQSVDESRFLHVRAKIRALYNDNPEQASRFFAAALEEGTRADAFSNRYGLALALMASNQYDRAREQIRRLRVERPEFLSYQIAEAEIEMAAGRYSQALELYRAAQQAHSRSTMVDLYTANALLHNNQHDQARQVIRGVIRKTGAEPKLYTMLARAEGELGNSLGAHQALAEYHYLMGNSLEALRQLRLARNYTADSFYAKASVDARIQEIEKDIQLSGEKIPPDRQERRERRQLAN